MIKVCIKDGKIIKIINEWFFDTEYIPEDCEVVDSDFSITDSIVYDDGELKISEPVIEE